MATRPGDFVSGDVLTAADMNALPAGCRDFQGGGSGDVTTSGTTELTIVTGTSFTVPASRKLRVSLDFSGFGNTAGDIFDLTIKRGATVVAVKRVQVQVAGYYLPGLTIVTYDAPAGGTYTYTATVTRISGTGTFTIKGTSSFDSWLLVEDMGTV